MLKKLMEEKIKILPSNILGIIFSFLVLFSLPLFGADQKNKKSSTIKPPKNFYFLKKELTKFDKRELAKILRSFVGESRPGRLVGTSGHEKARDYLINTIRSFDADNTGAVSIEEFNPDINSAIKMYQDDFKKEIIGKFSPDDPIYKKWDGFTKYMVKEMKSFKNIRGMNIAWEKKGYINPERLLIIGAHYDSIAHNKETMRIDRKSKMPGADDNGSGVTLALAAIKILSKYDLPKSVRVVFFDYEELGFLGSKAYVDRHKKSLLKDYKEVGYINLEMLGHDTNVLDTEKKTGNMRAYIRTPNTPGHAADKKLAEHFRNLGGKFTYRVQFTPTANSFQSSDHINFWEAGIPAVTFTQNWESDFNERGYHTADDFVETVNMTTLYHSYLYIVGPLIAWNFDLVR